MQEQNLTNFLNPEYMMATIRKRRWWLIVPVCLSILAGIYLSLTLDKIYKAETIILVEQQRVPENYVRSIVVDSIQKQIATISQQIMSRTNLEKIIREFGMYHEGKNNLLYMEDLVSSMRRRISVDVKRAGRDTGGFAISFYGKDPEKVRDITNALAATFIDRNLELRESQVLGTSDFLESELDDMRKKLEEKEKALRDYKFKYIGELPNQLDANLKILDRLQAQLADKENSLREAKENYRTLSTQTGIGISDAEKMRLQLADLLLKYTENHPDVIRLKKQIEELEKKSSTSTGGASNGISGLNNNRLVGISKADIERNINTLEREIEQIKTQIYDYDKRVEATPKHEQDLLVIQRDYDNMQNAYSSLLNRKLEAEIAVNMERKQKGQQFKIIDPARTPARPFRPDMKKLFLISIAAGFAIGGGIILAFEYLRPVFKVPSDIETHLGVEVLAAIPFIQNPRSMTLKRVNTFFTFAAMTVISLLIVILYIYTLGNSDMVQKIVDLI